MHGGERMEKAGENKSGEYKSAEQPQEPEVQVLSRDERDSFQGLTIEEPGEERQKEKARYSSGSYGQGRVHVRHYSFGSGSKMSWVTKIAIALVVLAVLSGMAVFGGIMILAAIIGWIVSRLFRR